jgi:molybdate transport system regulatory protein
MLTIIANFSIDLLELKKGKTTIVIVKASEVTVGKAANGTRLSARNVQSGVAANVLGGTVNSEVSIKLPGGPRIVASITKESAKEFASQLCDPVSAIVKATNVTIGV